MSNKIKCNNCKIYFNKPKQMVWIVDKSNCKFYCIECFIQMIKENPEILNKEITYREYL